MNLEQLRYFAAVASEESFTKAAERLFITKNGLTYQIKQLERELGFELFERDSHHVDLTPRGTVLLPAVREMLASWDSAVNRAIASVPDSVHTLEIGFAYFMDQSLLGRADAALKRYAPGATVHPHFSVPLNPSEFLGELAKGTLDAAFMSEREVGGSRSLAFEPLCTMHYGFHVAPDHTLARKTQTAWHDLNGETVVLLSGVRRPENHVFMEDTEALFRKHCPDAILVYADCLEAEKYIVEHEGAVGVFPFTCECEIDTQHLVLKVLDEEQETFGIAYPTASENGLLGLYLQACREAWGQSRETAIPPETDIINS